MPRPRPAPQPRPRPHPPPSLPHPRALRGAPRPPADAAPERPSGAMRGRGGGRARWPAPVRLLLRAFGTRDVAAAAAARGPAQGKRAPRGGAGGLGAGERARREPAPCPRPLRGGRDTRGAPRRRGGRLPAPAVLQPRRATLPQRRAVSAVVRRWPWGLGAVAAGDPPLLAACAVRRALAFLPPL